MNIYTLWIELHTKILANGTLSTLLGVDTNCRADSADTSADYSSGKVVIIIHSPTEIVVRYGGKIYQYVMTIESANLPNTWSAQNELKSLFHGKTLTESGTTTIICTGANPVGFDTEAARYRGSITFEATGT